MSAGGGPAERHAGWSMERGGWRLLLMPPPPHPRTGSARAIGQFCDHPLARTLPSTARPTARPPPGVDFMTWCDVT